MQNRTTNVQMQNKTNNVQMQNRNTNNVNRSESKQEGINRSDQTRMQTKTQAGATRMARPTDPAPVRINNPTATRTYREQKGSLTRDDGTIYRHQNDEIFTKSTIRVDYDNPTTFRNSDGFRRDYHEYNTWYDDRRVRYYDYNSGYRPISIELRRERNIYRQPMHYDLIWTPYLFNRFMYYYPYETDWNIEYGREIETISAYDVMSYVGSVRRVYGEVAEVYFSREDNNFILYIGERFPYQDLSIVIPRSVARMISPDPERYFENQDVWLIGLIELWDERPEIVVRDAEQIRRY
jgi:hypothetical protein